MRIKVCLSESARCSLKPYEIGKLHLQEYPLKRKLVESCLIKVLSNSVRFLNKALLAPDGSNGYRTICSISKVEEAKAVVRLWASCLAYAIVFSQTSTLFTNQGATMDSSIGSTFQIPATTLQFFIGLSIMIL